MATTPVFLSGKFHGQRSLSGYRPWGHKRIGQVLATKQKRERGGGGDENKRLLPFTQYSPTEQSGDRPWTRPAKALCWD